uniref:F-ATPase gamma subunit n=3 Tax=Eukaryota TaxID=2759 RepID=A0A7S1FZ43_9STRA|mmetsp:Transcript_40431/g.94990  ORF Transcript_40431/g.94990 Transcript_40431/m.94990 type:complete len:364 (+) Transcript_40431:231-1322(+)
MKLLCLASFLAVATAFAPSKSFLGNSPATHVVDNRSHATRRGTIVMDGKANAIRDRIVTVKNTKKITLAMKLVAAAKVRRAQDAVVATRPFSETLQSVFGGLIERLGADSLDLPLLTSREVKTATLVVVTGDRGLCGGYNNFIIKKAEKRIEDLQAQGIKVEIITVGKKGTVFMNRYRKDLVVATYECGQNPSSVEATAISNTLLNRFLGDNTDTVEFVYTRFVSLIASTPSSRTLLPCSATGIETQEDEIFQLTSKDGDFSVEKTVIPAAEPQDFPSEMIFEQDPAQIINSMLPLYLNGQVLRMMQEAVASELAARMQAMQSASDNASDLEKNLSQQYNRARQAAVTQEILEIVSGAQALEE